MGNDTEEHHHDDKANFEHDDADLYPRAPAALVIVHVFRFRIIYDVAECAFRSFFDLLKNYLRI